MPPLYEYIHPETNERIELLQSVHDEHKYSFGGVEWQRVWSLPQISMDTKIDPFNQKQFLEKTSKPGTLGDLWDRASDLSSERAQKDGVDNLKVQYEKDYSKKRGGKVKAPSKSVSSDIIVG
jgi:hypothetical protein